MTDSRKVKDVMGSIFKSAQRLKTSSSTLWWKFSASGPGVQHITHLIIWWRQNQSGGFQSDTEEHFAVINTPNERISVGRKLLIPPGEGELKLFWRPVVEQHLIKTWNAGFSIKLSPVYLALKGTSSDFSCRVVNHQISTAVKKPCVWLKTTSPNPLPCTYPPWAITADALCYAPTDLVHMALQRVWSLRVQQENRAPCVHCFFPYSYCFLWMQYMFFGWLCA